VPDPYLLEHFDALMDGRLLPVRWEERWRVRASDDEPVAAARPRARSPEAIEGTLWGGNLSLVAAAVGTPYLPAVEDGILFLEDVAEHPYRVERMLHQLLHAGVLATQQAVVLGEFTEWKPSPHDNGYDLRAVVDHFRARIAIPVITGLPFGHVPRKAVLGIGERYRLERDGEQWQLTPPGG
jgi:muramoyltetrapeptide carboxypeptidase